MGAERDRDECQLAEAALQGDADAQDALFRSALPRLTAFVRHRRNALLLERCGEEDLVQTVCREAVRDLGAFEYRGPKSFEHWLLARASNKLRNKSRAERAQKRDPARVEDAGSSQMRITETPSRAMAQHESQARLAEALDQLPEHYRQIIELIRFEGRSYAEAAAVMGRREGALRMLFTRAIGQLGALLAAQTR
ncbi:MAG: sigma-70 family RNA polymerase sigma factor [Planctomycetota bacterium]